MAQELTVFQVRGYKGSQWGARLTVAAIDATEAETKAEEFATDSGNPYFEGMEWRALESRKAEAQTVIA